MLLLRRSKKMPTHGSVTFIGHEDQQERLANGLYRQNARDIRAANKQRSRGLARVKKELSLRSKMSGFPDRMAIVVNEYRRRANEVLEEFASSRTTIQVEYTK